MATTTKRAATGLLPAVTALLLTFTGAAHAQLADASASSLALAGNNTASARGFQAISVNPAGLAMPGSGFSLAIVPVQVRIGLDPVGWSDLVDYEGRLVPQAQKEDWLTRVVGAGGESGAVRAEVTGFALTLGGIGFQLSSIASADVNIPPGVVEAVLFGNAGRTGTPAEIALVGATVESFATTTGALSFGAPINSMVSVGVTGKYTHGHAMAVGRSEGGSFDVDPIQATLDFPLVSTCLDEIECSQDIVKGGSGFGLDVGVGVDLGGLTVGASVQNVINNFEWDVSKLGYRPGTLLLTGGDYDAEYDELPYDDAPADMKAVVTNYDFKPSYRAGVALDLSSRFTVTGDLRGTFQDEGIELAPDYHVGVGAEMRLPLLHLRAGMSKITAGMQYGAGASLVLGPVNLSLAGGLLRGDVGDAVMAQFALSFGNR